MAIKIDYLLQDCEALIQTIDDNRSAMTAKGFSDSNYTALIDAKENLKSKEAAQQKAVKLVGDKTAEQNLSITEVTNLIKKIRNSARSSYGNDERNLKLFRIGELIPTSVKKLRPMCEYLSGLILEKQEMLLQNGLMQEDIDELNSAYGKLVSVDASQENAKKLQVTATLMRDEAAEKLKDKMFRARNFANACFSKNPEILIQFKPIAKGAGGRKEAENVPEEKEVPVG
ncbi:MAG: hypothetical protein NTX65_14720 [Ignavibacteriales bacterium]|nr:hypothetical protein [Ignavibacteriales bacterium]